MNDIFNDDYLIQSSSYSDIMNGIVLPWLQEKEERSTIRGFEGRPLYTVSYQADDPVATVLLVHGFTENAFKYAELIWSLLHLRYSVIAFDQRGHGRSWRAEGIPSPSVTHVDRFSDYVSDLRCVCDQLLPKHPLPFFIFGHSMGGAVTSLFLEQYHDLFSAAVLSSPMIAPHTGGLPASFASSVARIAKAFRLQKKNPFFMKLYSGPEDFASSCATDPERFAWYDQVKASRSDFQNSVPSWQWTYEAIHVTSELLAPGAPERIACPVLLFAAGSDHSVLAEPQKEFISRVPEGRYVTVAGSRHEIFRSQNDVLFPWWHTVIAFFNQYIPSVHQNGGLSQ